MSGAEERAEEGHWSKQKDVAHSDAPIRFTVALVKHIPFPLLACMVYPVSFFYYICSPKARREAVRYQRQLIAFSGGKALRRPNAYRQIESFSFELMQKVYAWSGKADLEEVIFHDDDVVTLKEELSRGKGALLITSHLGNMELLRCLASYGETGVERQVPVTVVMDLNTTSHFNNTMGALNERFKMNIIPIADIGIESMEKMQDCLNRGGLVVLAGDRTSPAHPERNIRCSFLGKDAPFPYGSFMLAALLKLPVYFVFSLREKGNLFSPKYNMFVHKAITDLDCPRKERKERVQALCVQFAQLLEHYCTDFPYQWYNFFNFWLFSERGGLHGQKDNP